MQVLGSLGMSMSDNMVPSRLENPEGYFEDLEIVEVHKNLFNELQADPTLPLPSGWRDTAVSDAAKRQLKAIIEDRLFNTKTIWGFKDPRTPCFLPLWARVFNSANIVPNYIFAVRNPATFATSLKRYTNRDESISELQWLLRTCEALYHTAADCYIVHYEDFLKKPAEVASELLDYTGLNNFFQNNVSETIKGIIKTNLNRSVYDDYTIQNEHVLKLYNELKECHGKDFNREKLMVVVQDCRKAMDSFKGWSIIASKVVKQNRKLQKGTADKFKNEIAEKNKVLEKLVNESNKYLKECKDLNDKLSDLRIKNKVQSKEMKELNKRIEDLNKRIEDLKERKSNLENSFSYKFGHIFVKAVKKPGKNTLMAPIRVIKLIFSSLYAQ
jgi:hypothetical protein